MEMKKIASFTINHDVLAPGMYVSRVDGDVVTYDLRMKKPNGGDYLAVGAMHTLEHLLATYARSSALADSVVYVGPMGCRTGFYLLLRDTVTRTQAVALARDALRFAADFDGAVPGVSARECGNYREHDLPAARAEARAMLPVLAHWTAEDMVYPV